MLIPAFKARRRLSSYSLAPLNRLGRGWGEEVDEITVRVLEEKNFFSPRHQRWLLHEIHNSCLQTFKLFVHHLPLGTR